MATWDDYKNHVRGTNPGIGEDIDEVEAASQSANAERLRLVMERFREALKEGAEEEGCSLEEYVDDWIMAWRNLELPPHRKIIRNAIRCNHCGDVIESTYRHNFVTCSCGRVSVDGGLDYLRRCGNPEDYTDLSEYGAD